MAEIDVFPAAVLAARFGAGPPERLPDPDEDGISGEDRQARLAALKARDAHRWPAAPAVPNLGDLTAPDFLPRFLAHGIPDVIVAGTPCFPAGTMIATQRGFVPIESVQVGDHAVTHEGRFRRVTATGSKSAGTVVLRGQGHPCMVTTADHPFLSRQRIARSTRSFGLAVRETWWSKRAWTPAAAMPGRHWAMLARWPAMPIPQMGLLGQERVFLTVTPDLLWLAGAYAGDGWTRINERRGYVLFGVNERKAAHILPRIRALGLHATVTQERTTIRIQVAGRALARWMAGQFGPGAAAKTVPMWLLGAPEEMRRAFVAGYAVTDGSRPGDAPWIALKGTTVSRQLALTMRALGVSLGNASSVALHTPPPATTIEGRTVSQQPAWSFTFSTSSRSSVLDEAHHDVRWQLVRSCAPTGEFTTVYDLTVEEDHSYVADGIVVHNCQDFSIAGLRAGLNGARGNLTMVALALLEGICDAARSSGRPAPIFLWENVPGVLSDKRNAFGCFLAGLVGHDAPLRAAGGRSWGNAGLVAGPRRRAAWRVLDAQYFGLAQRRARVFLVASAGDGPDPAPILLERAGRGRHPPARRSPRQGAAGHAGGGAGGGGIAATLTGSDGGPSGKDMAEGQVIPVPALATTLRARDGAKGVDSDATDTLIPVPTLAGTLCGNGKAAGSATQQDAETGMLIPVLGFDAHSAGAGTPLPALTARSRMRLAYGGNNTSGPIDVAPALLAQPGSGWKGDFDSETFIAEGPVCVTGDRTHALSAEGADASEDGTGRGTPIVAVAPEAWAIQERAVSENPAAGPGGKGFQQGIAYTLEARHHVQGVAHAMALHENQRGEITVNDTAGALKVGGGKPGQGYPAVLSAWQVRRLLPVECERLQGFPDGWTAIAWRGAPASECPDGRRYKALGNSMAVPKLRWIMARIRAALARPAS